MLRAWLSTVVVVVLAVVPWRYMGRRYVTESGDRWRRSV
jgi:hypothetical protein